MELKDEFYTRSEFCKLYDFTSQQLDYYINNGKIDMFEKDGRKYVLNTEKNTELGKLNKENKKFKSKYK